MLPKLLKRHPFALATVKKRIYLQLLILGDIRKRMAYFFLFFLLQIFSELKNGQSAVVLRLFLERIGINKPVIFHTLRA
jgi:hypothetical protein